MKKLWYWFVIIVVAVGFSCNNKSGKQQENENEQQVTFETDTAARRLDVWVDNQLLTSFRWPDSLTKPVFYPILSPDCYDVTRGFPLEPRAGERADHPHQIGMWFTYGNVNGLDFWGNGSQGPGTTNPNGGIIKHLRTENIKAGTGEGSFVSEESWQDTTGTELLHEKTEYHFIAEGKNRIIDRVTTLTAGKQDVQMPDTKEGMFGIRVARQLELPDKGNVILYNADGTTSRTRDTLNTDITGNYTSSEGTTGLEVWGTRARWMKLQGEKDGVNVSIIICDHPDNPNYPTYWHARGYGLFAANPLGVKDFTDEKDTFNFSIPAGESATFRYRVIVNSGEQLNNDEINQLADDFASKY